MRESFVNYLICPICGGNSFRVVTEEQNTIEIREGYVWCNACQNKFTISKGVLNFLANPSPLVEKAQKGWLKYDLLPWGLPFKLKDMNRYEKQILALPNGDDSDIFKRETLFQNISSAAYAFYQGLSLLGLTGKERLLDLGADICWSTNRFAELGCQCIALDLNHHLPVSDVYIYKNNVYFERMIADMSDLPFADESFDIVVTVTSIHHTPDLEKTFREIARVLIPLGKVILINEPVRKPFAPKDFGSKREKELGLNDHWYTALEYYLAARKAGLKLTFKHNIRPVVPANRRIKRKIKSFLNKHPWITEFTTIPIPILWLYPFNTIMIAHKRLRRRTPED